MRNLMRETFDKTFVGEKGGPDLEKVEVSHQY
jgi:hypothetical protein